jgi:hypothetical protein
MWGGGGSGGTNNTSGAGDKLVNLTGVEPTGGTPYVTLGSATDLWGRGSWPQGDVTSSNFRVRVWNMDPAGATAATRCQELDAGAPDSGIRNPGPGGGVTPPSAPVAGEVYVDMVQVVVHYHTYTWVPDPNVVSPYNDTLNARGLWGTFINQGAEKINGDAYLPKWNPRTNPQNNEYNPNLYYNYAIEMPAGATEGEVWIYDAPFCATDTGGQYGTGDRYFGGSTAATSAFYTLWDTRNTPFDLNDDTALNPVSRAHSIFANIQADDDTLFGSGSGPVGTSCTWGTGGVGLNSGRYWHNRWYPMQPYVTGNAAEEVPASGEQPHPLDNNGPDNYAASPRLPMLGGNTYRLHTRSTDPLNATAQDNANGHNSFSIWTRAWCGGSVCPNAPRVFGLGAMEAFTPLLGGGAATFYLAEIDPIHAGKSVEIRLWDPGDTAALPATLRVKVPYHGSYVDAPLDWAATANASGANNCTGQNDGNVNPPNTVTWPNGEGAGDPYIVANTGGSQKFGGCWLTIVVVIPSDYDGTAPTAGDQNWWKIEYSMGGTPADNAFDLTTWQVTLRGNPVHLVVP